MENKNIENFLNKTKSFFKEHRHLVISLFSFIILFLIALPIWLWYKEEKEKALSYEVNDLIQQIAQIEIRPKMPLIDEDAVKNVKIKLNEIFKKNSFFKNATRALFIKAHLDYQQGYLTESRNAYLKIFKKKRKNSLASQSLYYAAITFIEEGEYEKAKNLLEQFEKYYSSDYFLGEVLISKALTLESLGRYDQAVSVYGKILNHPSLDTYKNKATKSLQILKATQSFPSLKDDSPTQRKSPFSF